MLALMLTPMMIASTPLTVGAPPPAAYSHVTQTNLAQSSTQTTTSYSTTMPTVHTNTCNQVDGCPNGHDTDLNGSDSVVSDYN